MVTRFKLISFACAMCILFSCKKDKSTDPAHTVPDTTKSPGTPPATGSAGVLFSDSVLYVNDADDYKVTPVNKKPGVYSAVPEGLKIEELTGAINVNKSETGLKYLVTFTPNDGSAPQSASLIVSGINYADGIYNLSNGDSIAAPIYNADKHLTLPGSAQNNVFDEGGGCGKAGIIVDPQNARINLAETVRKQLIDTGATAEVKLNYRISDQSNKALNGLDVKVYFYRTAAEIPQYLTDLLAERKNTILSSAPAPRITLNSVSLVPFKASAKPARPRPPCIIVVGR